jgi:hypothetical protein
MEVHAFDASGSELPILRLEQVGPGMLLGIFDGVVQKLVLNEHPEALHFGVDEDIDDPDPSKSTKSFRYVTQVGDNQPARAINGTVSLGAISARRLRSRIGSRPIKAWARAARTATSRGFPRWDTGKPTSPPPTRIARAAWASTISAPIWPNSARPDRTNT